MARKKRSDAKTKRKNIKTRYPKVNGLVVEEESRDPNYVVKFDCPWCGQEHRTLIYDTPPIFIQPSCGMGYVNLHRVDVPADDPVLPDSETA